jgi:quercetin dioxygenase-like cupin family protein
MGARRPALQTALAAALLAGVAACVRPEPGGGYGTGIRSREVLKTQLAADGKALAYLRAGEPELTVLEVEIPAGAETGWHHHPVPVFAYVLEGELSVTLATGKVQVYGKGQAIAEAVDLPHTGRNAGPGTVRLAVFYCGAKGVPNVVKDAPPGVAGQLRQ